jgi:hypothetical protein
MNTTTFEAVKEALTNAGYAQSRSSNEEQVIVAVTDDGEGSGNEALKEIQGIAKAHGCVASWTGDGNTDSDGESTSDIAIESEA